MLYARRSRGGADPDSEPLSPAELAALIDAAQVVNNAVDVSGALDAILATALELLDADEGSVILFDHDRSLLRIRASQGLPPEVVQETSIEPGRGIAGSVAATGKPLLLPSDAEVERYADAHDRQRRIRSAVSVPLRFRGQVEGVLNVAVTRERGGRELNHHDLRLATLFAEFAASAVHNTRLHSQLRRRAEALGVLFEASHALSEALEVEEVAARILDAAEELVGATGGLVCALPESRRGLEVALYRGTTRGRVMAAVHREDLTDLLRATTVRVLGDLRSDRRLAPLATGEEPVSGVVAPLANDDVLRGLLVAMTPAPGPDDDQIRLLSTYVSHASLALGKAIQYRSMRAKEEELASLVSAVPDPIVIVDADGRFLAINPAAAQQFGLTPSFEVGRPTEGKLRSHDLEEILLAEGGGRAEVTLFNPQPRTFRARATPVRPGHGPSGARILILEDVTADKEAAQLKSDFVAVTGHELRTPLTLIKGYVDTLTRGGANVPQETRERALQAVRAQSIRLERLIEDLLLVAGIERGRPALHLEEGDLQEAVRAVVERFRADHPSRDIRLTCTSAPPAFAHDTEKVHQVLRHLLDNALKFSDPAAPVDVEVEGQDGAVEVRVRDRGEGVFSGDIPHLFERFHQVDGTTTRAHGGTGVGLYICKTLVEAHGGHIGVRSALGRGSTFWVRLPTQPPAPPSPEPTG